MDKILNKSEKILVIEGDQSLGEKIVKALKDDGYQNVILSTNGKNGLKEIYELPHLVLVDINLPEMDGYAVVQAKQKEPLLAKIPVFLMSMQGVPINMRQVPANSVKEYLMAIHADSALIVKKVNNHFGHNEMQEPENTNTDPNAKKILWIEDDKLIGMILARKIMASGFNLTHAKNGDEAMKYLENHIPDAIVVDLLLPGMSGFDILQKVKTQDHLKNVPTMVLSNLSKPSDIERAQLLGAKKFLVKAATSLDQIVEEIGSLCK